MPNVALSPGSLAGTLLLAVAGFPLVAALAVLVAGPLRSAVQAFAYTLLAALSLAVAFAAFAAPIRVTIHTVVLPTATLPLTMMLDHFGAIVLVALALAESAVGMFSVGYVHEGRNARGYFAILWLAIAALNATVLAGDLVMLFTAAVLVSVTLMLLVALDFADQGAAAGLRVFVMTGLAGATGLTVACLALAEAPDVQLTTLAAEGSRFARPEWQPMLLALLVALAIRAGLAPLHTWVTGTWQGTLPTVGVVVGVLGVVSGAATLARLATPLFGHDRWWLDSIATLGAATLIVGGIGALRSPDAMQALAFLAIAQAGLAATAVGTGALGAEVAGLQLLHASLALSLVYLAVSRAQRLTGALSLAEIWRIEPIAGVALLIGGLSVAGWPATSGYLPRALLVAKLLHGGSQIWTLWLVAVLFGTAITSWATLRLLWLSGTPGGAEPVPSSSVDAKSKRIGTLPMPRGIALSLVGLSGACLVLGIAGQDVWERVVLPSSGVSGSASTQSPVTDLLSMMLAHASLILVFGIAAALRATEIGQAPVNLHRGDVRIAKRLGLVARLGGRALRLTESRWLDIYHVGWTVLLAVAQASAFLLDQTLGRLSRPS